MAVVTPSGRLRRSSGPGKRHARLQPADFSGSQAELNEIGVAHLFSIATEYFTSHGRIRCPPGNSRPKRLTKQARFVRTASFVSFTALSANPLLVESYRTLSSPLTFTPANFYAVAVDSFRARMACSLSDLMRTSVKPLQVTSFLSSATAYSSAPFVGTMAAPIQRPRSHLLTKIGATAISRVWSSRSFRYP